MRMHVQQRPLFFFLLAIMCSSDLAQPGKVETDDGHGSITCLAAHHACRCTRAIHTSSEPRGRGSCKCLAKNGAAGRSACVRDATTTQHRQQHTRCRCMVTMPIEAAGRTAYAWLLLLLFVGAASAERRSGAVPSRGCGSISSGSGGTVVADFSLVSSDFSYLFDRARKNTKRRAVSRVAPHPHAQLPADTDRWRAPIATAQHPRRSRRPRWATGRRRLRRL